MDSLTAARERHVPLQRDPFGNLEPTVSRCCAACKQPWGEDGCDFVLAIEALDEAQECNADLMRLCVDRAAEARAIQEWSNDQIDIQHTIEERHNRVVDERNAARALADELAAALEAVKGGVTEHFAREQARLALQHHREARR